MTHPIESIVKTTLENLGSLICVKTVIGDPVRLGESTLVVPVSRVTLGFVSGGGEYDAQHPVQRSGLALNEGRDPLPFAATTAAGIAVTPVSFLTVQEGCVAVLDAETPIDPISRALDRLPELMELVGDLIKQKREEKQCACQCQDEE